MCLPYLILVLIIEQHKFGDVKRDYGISAQRSDVCSHHSQQFGNEAMDKSADATIFPDRRALPNKEKV